MSNKIININLTSIMLLGAMARGSYVLGFLNERQTNEHINSTNYYYSVIMGMFTGAISSWILTEGFVFTFNLCSKFYNKK
ncbi:hypothetical protein QLL95_gp0029 [Cotonvirus japonicus]|uniref:Uncharacterized protein n=1 Tax=Cotonvirus japonicus TaxID=2811091 RepID=A0ABM7NQT1_9VIRU|nr:hypothetical protein QLL95_gp0029 [Cotonvirus japonicus]BCS82518.1 hypothetical protein [Cotonvirus japonicus]